MTISVNQLTNCEHNKEGLAQEAISQKVLEVNPGDSWRQYLVSGDTKYAYGQRIRLCGKHRVLCFQCPAPVRGDHRPPGIGLRLMAIWSDDAISVRRGDPAGPADICFEVDVKKPIHPG